MEEDGGGKGTWSGRKGRKYTRCQNFINKYNFSRFRLTEFKFRISDNNPSRLSITRSLKINISPRNKSIR